MSIVVHKPVFVYFGAFAGFCNGYCIYFIGYVDIVKIYVRQLKFVFFFIIQVLEKMPFQIE